MIVPIVLKLDVEEVKKLHTEKILTSVIDSDLLPAAMLKVVYDYMQENTGFTTGPIMALSRLNGEPLKLSSTNQGDLDLDMVLSLVPGDVVLEVEINDDSIVSIELETLLGLISDFKKYGEDFILDKLRDSLCKGSISSENVYTFAPMIKWKNCKNYFIVTEQWKYDDSKVFIAKDMKQLELLNLFGKEVIT